MIITASIKWAPVVLSNGGQGAFEITLSSTANENSSLGYVLSGIRCDDFMVLAVPVLETLRRMYLPDRNIFEISPAIHAMHGWMKRHNHNTDVIDYII